MDKTQTPIQNLNEYSDYLENDIKETYHKYIYSDSDLLEIVTEATTQIDGASGWDTESERTPTAREILLSINNALYHHFNEEDQPNG